MTATPKIFEELWRVSPARMAEHLSIGRRSSPSPANASSSPAENEITTQALADRAQEIQERIQAQDPVALKNAYRELFEVVWVSPSPSDGTIQLNFTLRGHQAEAITEEKMFGVGAELVGPPGLQKAFATSWNK